MKTAAPIGPISPVSETKCELRPGIGLCDGCSQPKWPQTYIGCGIMLCADCLAASRKPTSAAEHNAFPKGRWS